MDLMDLLETLLKPGAEGLVRLALTSGEAAFKHRFA
jgi:hypothetical protein